MKIYIDMDSVLTDFKKMFNDNSKLKLETIENSSADVLWREVRKIPRFWEDMLWMPDGKKLWDFVRQFNISILTSPTRHDERSKPGKLEWVNRELGSIPVIFSRGIWKKEHLKVGDIFIDDLEENLTGIAEGIHGILHRSADETINEITRIIGTVKNEASRNPT